MTAAAHRLRRLALLVTAALLSSCGLFEKNDPTVERAGSVAEATSATLLDPGSEPRRPLRFELTTGASVDLGFTFDIDLTQRTTDAEEPVVLDPPTTTQTVRLTVGSTDDDGAVVDFEVIDAGFDPNGTTLTDAQTAELTAAIRRLVGLRGELRIDQRGGAQTLRYDPPDGLPAAVADTLSSLEQNLSTVVPVLPTEAVGRGARWRIVARSSAGGLMVRQTTEYELTGMDDGRLTYRATISQTAPEQDVEGDGSQARILAADVVGTATGMVSTADLRTESETTLTGTQVIEQATGVDGEGGAPRRVTQDIEITITVDSTTR